MTSTQQPRLHCILGTRAQIIKMAPVIQILETENIPVNIVMTGQHKDTVDELFADFGIKSHRHYVYDGEEINGILRMLLWLPKVVWRMLRNSHNYFPEKKGIVIVHGDTVSTVAGALVGKILGMKVAHVEAGLRSFSIFHPFPEELTRLVVFRFSDIAYCPGTWAMNNMAKYSCERSNTGMNTIVDAIGMVLTRKNPVKKDTSTPPSSYGVISIHRFENIFQETRLRHIVDMLGYASSKTKLIFVLHPATEKRLKHTGLFGTLQSNPSIELRPRMGYTEFIRLIMQSKFVVTDGGSNQEELSLTNIPVLLMRKATERQEGIGKNIVLGHYDESAFKAFIDNATIRNSDRPPLNLPEASPSAIICQHLLTRLNQ